MTRSSKLALVTLLAGLLSLVTIGTIGAAPPCIADAQGNCEEMTAAAETALVLAAPVHVLAATGIGKEHFEAMSDTDASFRIAAPSVAASYRGAAREQYEVMQATSASN